MPLYVVEKGKEWNGQPPGTILSLTETAAAASVEEGILRLADSNPAGTTCRDRRAIIENARTILAQNPEE